MLSSFLIPERNRHACRERIDRCRFADIPAVLFYGHCIDDYYGYCLIYNNVPVRADMKICRRGFRYRLFRAVWVCLRYSHVRQVPWYNFDAADAFSPGDMLPAFSMASSAFLPGIIRSSSRTYGRKKTPGIKTSRKEQLMVDCAEWTGKGSVCRCMHLRHIHLPVPDFRAV